MRIRRARLVEGPDKDLRFPRGDVGHVGLVVLHRRELDHEGGVPIERLFVADDHLAQQLALVGHYEAHGFAVADFNH